MIRPQDVERAASRKTNENARFRSFLKMNADPGELDKQFEELHMELFADYDCASCRNCCRKLGCYIDRREVKAMAEAHNMTSNEFKGKYLEENQGGSGSYTSKTVPCVFLLEDGACMLGENKPADCKDYPYTLRPDRISSLLSIMDNASVCPVVYEMIERLKKIYGFR